MKCMLALCLFISSTVWAKSKAIIISDLDDTFKITNTVSPVAAVWNGFFTKKAFVGMPSLYKSLTDVESRYFLSNSPNLLRSAVKGLFRKHNIKVHKDHLILRKDLRADSFAYKFDTVESILQSSAAQKAILIGDDSGEDHEVYEAVRHEYPESIEAIYIRPVKGKQLPEGVIKYSTAFDIALNEFTKGSLSKTELLDLGQEILENPKKRHVFPKYLQCPEDAPKVTDNEIQELALRIHRKIMSLCQTKEAS